MTDHIEMRCPHCRHGLRVRPEFVGHRVRCGFCRNAFDAVAGDEPAAAPCARVDPASEAAGPPDAWKGPCGDGVPGYETLALVSNGSMGRVYKARQPSVDRLVAIKVMHEDLALNGEYVERFRREAVLAARLAHTNIVHLIDAGKVGDCPYLVMEYAAGETAQERLDARGAFDEGEAVRVAVAVAEALGHLQERGLIHRDIKPANVILTPDGGVKLIDFGLARPVDDAGWAAAEEGSAIGTPESISPEQTRGQVDVDVRCDIYGLGTLLYHLVTGRPAFAGTSREVVLQHADPLALPVPPGEVNPDISVGLAAVLARMMAKDREDRYRDPGELLTDLTRVLEGRPAADEGQGPAEVHEAGDPAGAETADEGDETSDPLDRPDRHDAETLAARAEVWLRRGDYAKAVAGYSAAIRLEPGRARVFRGRGDALWASGDHERALADYTEALRISPEDAPSLHRRGRLHSLRGDYARARADLFATAGLAPDWPPTWNRLAWLLATCPDPRVRDGAAAVAAAARACEATGWEDPNLIDTLAAAHAEAGCFDAAVEGEERALSFLRPANPRRPAFLARLELYRAKQPYREAAPGG